MTSVISLFHQVIRLTWPDGYILIIFVGQEKISHPTKNSGLPTQYYQVINV